MSTSAEQVLKAENDRLLRMLSTDQNTAFALEGALRDLVAAVRSGIGVADALREADAVLNVPAAIAEPVKEAYKAAHAAPPSKTPVYGDFAYEVANAIEMAREFIRNGGPMLGGEQYPNALSAVESARTLKDLVRDEAADHPDAVIEALAALADTLEKVWTKMECPLDTLREQVDALENALQNDSAPAP